MVSVYGLKTCDTCRKALKWLMEEGIPHRFVDFRKDGVSEAEVTRWLALLGWETLINNRGTTWRALSEEQRKGLDNAAAKALILEYPALMKRPVFVLDDQVLVGFKAEQKEVLREQAAPV